MTGFNKVILAGNLTRDPELRYTASGTAIARFGLACSRRWKDTQSNEQREEVMFIDVDAFGKTAEIIGQYLKKGRPILLEGRLKLDQWDDKQTQQKRSRHLVVMDSFTFLDSGNREGGDFGGSGGGVPSSAPSARPPRPQAAPPPAGAPEGMPPEEDDVPF